MTDMQEEYKRYIRAIHLCDNSQRARDHTQVLLRDADALPTGARSELMTASSILIRIAVLFRKQYQEALKEYTGSVPDIRCPLCGGRMHVTTLDDNGRISIDGGYFILRCGACSMEYGRTSRHTSIDLLIDSWEDDAAERGPDDFEEDVEEAWP